MADLFGESAALLQGANTAASNYSQNQTAKDAERNKLFMGGQTNLTQLMGQVMQDQGAMARQKEATQAQMVDITPEIANGLVKTTGDPGWKQAVGQKMPVPVYTVLATKAAQDKLTKAKWKETTEIQGENEQRVLYNEEDPTQRIMLGKPGKRKSESYQDDINARQEKNLAVQEKGRYRQYFLDLEQRDPIIKEINKQQLSSASIDGLIKLVQDGNTVAFNALGPKMAKALGDSGALSKVDVINYIRSGKLTQKAGDIVLTWIEGKPTNATVGEIAGIANSLRDTYKEKIQPRYNQFIDTYSSIEGITPEEFSKKIKLPYTGGSGGGGSASTGGGSSKSVPKVGETFQGSKVISVEKVSD